MTKIILVLEINWPVKLGRIKYFKVFAKSKLDTMGHARPDKTQEIF